MKYIILHGSGGGPDMWQPWLKGELEKLGHEVWMPHMPDSEKPDLLTQLPFLLNSGEITPDCIIIGHSAACPLILSVLEKIDFKIRKAVLVAGYYYPTDDDKSLIWQEKYDFPKIKASCQSFLFIASDDDPWGCTDVHSKPYAELLGGELLTIKGGGHFGSNTWKKPLYEFPLLLELLLNS